MVYDYEMFILGAQIQTCTIDILSHLTIYRTVNLLTKLVLFYFISTLYFYYCCAGVPCGIYKSSYNSWNIPYLNLPPPPFSQFLTTCLYICLILFYFIIYSSSMAKILASSLFPYWINNSLCVSLIFKFFFPLNFP
jgi:hypothetical protein